MARNRQLSRRFLALAAIPVVVAAALAVVAAQRQGPAAPMKTVLPSADAYVSTAHATENFGRADTLRLDNTPRITSYLRFDFGPSPVHVVAAVLRLASISPHADALKVHAVTTGSWSEIGVTANNAPPYGAPLVTPADTHDGWTSIDVTPLVQDQRVVDIALTADSPQSLKFTSREGSAPPQLVLQLGSSPAVATPSPGGLAHIVEDVTGATGRSYATHDDTGASMDALKIVTDPRGGYLGVYHSTGPSGVLATQVATSTDLLHWRRRAVIDEHASQATVSVLADRGILLAEEADSNGSPGGSRTWVRLRHYRDVVAFLAVQADRSFDLPHTQVSENGAEGTPDIRTVELRPDIDRSTIELGFHYFQHGVVDRPAQGVLTNFQSWSAASAVDLDSRIEGLGVTGSIGDRDTVLLNNQRMVLVEAQAAGDDAWATYLYDEAGREARRMNIRTDGGSSAFANPTVTALRAPSGARAIVVTLFVPVSGAAHGEAGELVYFREITPRPANPDPVVVAAGDVACALDGTTPVPGQCEQESTARVVESIDPTAVLALGDEQYEKGTLRQFLDSYDPSWGRFRDITYPVPGNHEYGTPNAAGYFDYFGSAAGDRHQGWYSVDLGAWHVVALNSECANIDGGCGAGSPQEQWLAADLASHPARCTLAFWHEPLFSSGDHGGNVALTALWADLDRAGTDLVLSGHDHDYERFAPQNQVGQPDAGGIRQFVVGTGGKTEREFMQPVANSESRSSGARGVLRLELHPGGYDWTFVPVAGATFHDAGSSQCH